MTESDTTRLTDDERRTLERALDALLPPVGSFPAPSDTDMIEAFILEQVPLPGTPAPYPGINKDALKEILAELAGQDDVTDALKTIEQNSPTRFQTLWALAVFGYYSRESVIAAIQTDLAPGYHGAPLPRGYAHVITPWDAEDPHQMPSHPPGSYIPTSEVQRVDLSKLDGGSR